MVSQSLSSRSRSPVRQARGSRRTGSAVLAGGLALLWMLLPPPDIRADEAADSEGAAGAVPRPSYFIAAQEVAAVNLAIWAFDAYVLSYWWAQIDGDSIWRNINHPFVYDDDTYDNNVFFHPYHGTLYFTAARSCGLGFGISTLYTLGGSLIWEVVCETKPPSLNDLLFTVTGGSLLGEALFRLSRLVLDGPSGARAGRRFSSTLLSPMAGINDILLDERSRGGLAAPAAWAGRMAIGGGGGFGDRPRAHLRGDFTYGLPAVVEPRRPFDHFDLSFDLFFDGRRLDRMVQLRGLLLGAGGEGVAGARLLAGLYGAFEYAAPAELRYSSSALGPGFTVSLDPDGPLAVEASLVLAPAFGSGGARVPLIDRRDYAYGYGLLGVADLRAHYRNRLELRAAVHTAFYPFTVGGGAETTQIGTGSLQIRLFGPHSLALYGLWSSRQARLPGAEYRERGAYYGLAYLLELGGGAQR